MTTRVRWEVTTTHKQNTAASFTLWDYRPDTAVYRAILWEGVDRMPEYVVTVTDLETRSIHHYNGDSYVIEPGQAGSACCECGAPCDAADAVADDSGLAWCGSLYGNGCADTSQDAPR